MTVSSFGPLKTFFGALQQSVFLNGVSLVFGMEEINSQRYQPPAIVLDVRGGACDAAPGYAANMDPTVEALWEFNELIDFWLVVPSSLPNAQGPVDHTDAMEALLPQLLSALQDQRAQYSDVANVSFGLAFKVLSRRWETMANAVGRYGRALVLSVDLKITVPMAAASRQATIQTLNAPLNQTFVDKPS